MNKNIPIEGEKKGGGGGSYTPVQDANTYSSRAVVRVLEVLSEGEIEGLATGDAQSIFFDGTPVQNADASYNFSNVTWGIRYGLPSQPYMEGFPSAEATTSINTNLTTTNPVTVQVSNVDIDAVRIALQFTQGLKSQESNGNMHGGSVQVAFDVRLDSNGTWNQIATKTITETNTQVFEIDFRIERPTGTGLWSWRVRRLTADSTSAMLINNTAISRYTEIQDVKIEYNDSAYVGIAVNAESTGNAIPVRSYLVRGIKCQVPSNYDPVTRTYSGQWNGVFKRAWTCNPAWIVYDLLTNERYGMGERIRASVIDKYSFYNAAVYNDQYVPSGLFTLPANATIRQSDGAVLDSNSILIYTPESGATEPRFTFNTPISVQENALKVIQAVASSMRAVVLLEGSIIRVSQDRPSNPVKPVTNANVIDGKFSYSRTPLQERHTVARVTWNDKDNKYAADIATVEDVDGITKYGRREVDVAAYGATTKGQAIRAGKWLLDTELQTLKIVNYTSSFEQFDLKIGDVIKLWDKYQTEQESAGRIVSAVNATVVLDRLVTVTTAAMLEVTLSNGTLQSLPIIETDGEYDTVTVDGNWSITPLPANATYIVTDAVSPRLFRVSDLAQEENNITVTALEYDSNKYIRIENDIVIAPPVYSAIQNTVVLPVTNIVFTPEAYTDPIIGTQLSLRVTWTEPLSKYTIGYDIKWQFNNGETHSEFVTTNSFKIPYATAGGYSVQITAVNVEGKKSLTAVESFTQSFASTNALLPPTAITLIAGHGTGTSFIGNHLFVEWAANPTNLLIPNQTVGGYQVDVYDSSTGLIRRTETTNYDVLQYEYTLDKQVKDGGPVRSIRIDVYTLDATLRKSVSKATQTFSNAAPAVPNNIRATALAEALMVSFDKPTESDYAGTLIWASETINFTPAANLIVFDGDVTLVNLAGLTGSVPVYLRVAAYDTFNKSLNGAGLNLSPQITVTPNANSSAGIASVPTLPATASEGTVVYLSTDGKLYRWHNGAWTASVSAVDVTGTFADAQLAGISATKITGLLVGDQITAGTITGDKIAANSIGADQIVANSIGAGQLIVGELISSSSQLGDAVITNAAIVDGTILNAKIGNVSADKIQTGTLGVGTTITVGSGVSISSDGTIQSVGTTKKTVMSNGDVLSYKNVGGTWYPYQGLNHVEMGQATNATQVTIPGYFVSQPSVIVSPANLQFFNPTYVGQAQSVNCVTGAITETSAGSMIWRFTPTATLNLAAATNTITVNAGSGDTSAASWTSATYTLPANGTTITPIVQLRSSRGNGSSQYFYRSMRWRVEYYNGAWITTDPFRTLAMGAQTTTAQSDSKTFTFPSAGAWQWRIYVEDFDTDGTVFGSVTYSYSNTTVAGSMPTYQTNFASNIGKSGSPISTVLSFGAATGSGEIYQVDYSWNATVSIVSSTVPSSVPAMWGYDPAGGYKSASLTKTSTGGNQSFVWTGTKTTASYVTTLTGSFYEGTPTPNIYVNSKLTMNSCQAVIYRRTVVANSTTAVNNSYLVSYGYTLSTAQVLATGTLNWLAVGA